MRTDGSIYIVTVMTELRERYFARNDGSVGRSPRRDKRTWGWYGELGPAQAALHANATDMHETCYDWAVIEEVGPGVPAHVDAEHWYRFDREARGYRPADKPEDLAQVLNFCLG